MLAAAAQGSNEHVTVNIPTTSPYDSDYEGNWGRASMDLKVRADHLQKSVRCLLGGQLDSLNLDELGHLEGQLESSLKNVHSRRSQLMFDLTAKLQEKGKMDEETNQTPLLPRPKNRDCQLRFSFLALVMSYFGLYYLLAINLGRNGHKDTTAIECIALWNFGMGAFMMLCYLVQQNSDIGRKVVRKVMFGLITASEVVILLVLLNPLKL